mgnify:CR=1 FL=1
MKKGIFGIVLLALFSFSTAETVLKNADKELAISEFNKSKKHLLRSLKGLNDAQLNFKSNPETWSIAECVEHIAISETNIFGMLQGALKTPADPSRRSEVKMKDEQIIGMMVDRSNRVKTSGAFEPSGKFGSHKETLKTFLKKRKQNSKYVKKTNDDLRNHYGQLPFGTLDGVQILLFISAHSERHILQIEEIMSHKDFPKK